MKKTYTDAAKLLYSDVKTVIKQGRSTAIESAGSDGSEWDSLTKIKQFDYLIKAVGLIEKETKKAMPADQLKAALTSSKEEPQKDTRKTETEKQSEQEELIGDPVKKAAEKIRQKTQDTVPVATGDK